MIAPPVKLRSGTAQKEEAMKMPTSARRLDRGYVMRKLSIAASAIALGASLASAPAYSANFIAAGDLEDGRVQVFAIQNGQIESRWKTSSDPNSGWTSWTHFQTPPGGVTSIAVGYLSDRD